MAILGFSIFPRPHNLPPPPGGLTSDSKNPFTGQSFNTTPNFLPSTPFRNWLTLTPILPSTPFTMERFFFGINSGVNLATCAVDPTLDPTLQKYGLIKWQGPVPGVGKLQPLSVFVSNVILKHSRAHPFLCCPQRLSRPKADLSIYNRLYGPQSLKYFPRGPLQATFADPWFIPWVRAWTLQTGSPIEGSAVRRKASRIRVSPSNNSCSRQFTLQSCSFKYILVRYNKHETWPVSTWLHAGENPAKSESTKRAQRKWNKLEICCFLFIRFKWELCSLANSQCGQVTIFEGIIFSSLLTCANAGLCFVPHLLQ